MRFLDRAAVAGVLRMESLIPAMREAMIAFSAGRIRQPPRRILEVEPHGGYFGAMPAVSGTAVGAKLLTFYPGNAAKDLDTHMALIALFRVDTGEPLAILDGGLITEMRTAAVTACFVDAAAAPDARRLAVLGAGAQGRSHIQALACVRNFDDVRVWNRTAARAEALAAKMGGTAVDREAAVRDADVVVVATGSAEPVLDGRWLKPGACVASVGWAGADGGELDAVTMGHVVVVDSREGTALESGNVRRYGVTPAAELGELLNGDFTPPPGATIVFDSIGMACQDVAAANLVLESLPAAD